MDAPIAIRVGSLASSKQSYDLVDASSILTERVSESFISIVDRLEGLWQPIDKPLLIPDIPDKTYYDGFALKFAQSYFYKNLLKCIITLEIFANEVTDGEDFVDLGAGSGAFSIATVASRGAYQLQLVDYSRAQLELASRAFCRYLSPLIEGGSGRFSCTVAVLVEAAGQPLTCTPRQNATVP